MNPNMMMIAKAMVAQEALREEAARSRRARRTARRPDEARSARTDAHGHGIFDILGLAFSGRR